MKRPLTGLVIVYASGIWIGSLLPARPRVLCYCVLGLIVTFVLLRRSRCAFAALIALVFSGGALAYRYATTDSSPNHISRILGLHDQNAVFRGTILSDPGYRTNEVSDAGEPAADRHSFKLRLAALKQSDEWRPAEGKLLVFVSEVHGQEPLRYGDVIECSAILRVPAPARNPGTFDWRDWLTRQNIHFTATIRETDFCTILARDRGNRITALSLRLRERFERALRLGLENEPRLAGVLAGMVIGQRSEIPADTYQDFQRTGVFHVFAINGLHVGLVTAVVLVFLRTMRIPRRWCGLVAIPLLVLYVFATGAHPGAVRALVMAGVWLMGWMLLRPTDSLNNLAVAALIILVWDPTQLFDGGFILSFTVVTAIVELSPQIESKLKPLVAPDQLLARRFVPKWRVAWGSLAIVGVKLFSCSLAAWVGLVPLLALYFHLFTPISIIANLLVIPMLTVIIALGLTATLAHAVWPWLTLTLNNATFFLLTVMTHGVEWLEKVPYSHQFVQAPPAWMIAGYYCVGVLLLSRRVSWPPGRLTVAIAMPAICAVTVFMAWPRDTAEITVLDLTDGPSMFVNLPGERDDWLIDGGGDWSGRRIVLPFLRGQGVDRLGALVLTRGDEAHAAGLTAIAQEIPIAQVIESGVPSRSKFYAQWRQAVPKERNATRSVRAGDEMLVANRFKVRVLNPPSIANSDRSDDNSLVLMLEFGPTRLLLMSDAGETVENRLLRAAEDLRAQIIIKGRHSKEPSCTDAFLDAVQPEMVVQTVSARPSDRYLQPELRERLQRRGVKLYRTDETGSVTIRLTHQGYTLHTWLQ
jgi:competence protein ComEC